MKVEVFIQVHIKRGIAELWTHEFVFQSAYCWGFAIVGHNSEQKTTMSILGLTSFIIPNMLMVGFVLTIM